MAEMGHGQYAVCQGCRQPMEPGRGCVMASIAGYKRIPCSQDDVPYGECHDCGVVPGQYHHLGCDMDICPICKNHQAFVCDCLLKHRIAHSWGWQGSRDELLRQIVQRDGLEDEEPEGEEE